MSFMSSTHQSQFDLGQSSTETVLLAKEQWEVIKLRRTWDLELKKFRERQSHRVRSVNAKANEKAKRLHEKVFFTMRWAHPKLSSAYQQLILEYCDHLTGPNPESNFEKFPFLTAWREKMVGTEAEKVFRTVTQLVTALADVVTHRNTSIRKTNEHTALQTERLAVQKEGSVSWKVHQTQSARDNYWTIWYLAKHNKQSELLRFLESPDCLPIDTFDPDHGFTALHYACMRGHFDIALLLLEAGANERAPSLCDGRTPLHMAAAYGSRELVLELLACGADENARDRFNCTPLQLARQNRNTAVAKTLENWNYLVPADIGSNDEENDLKEVIPEELVATDESIVSQMSRPLQVITRRLEAAVDVAATIRARIHVDTCLQVAQAQGVDSAPSQTAEDECFERETNSESAGNIAGTAVLLEIRLCEKHAYMSMEEGFPMEAIKSLRRRWRAAREYVNAIDSVNRHIDVQFGLNVNKEEFVSISDVLYPEVSFQYAVEIAMEAAELCLAYGKHEWAELIISEALLLRDFRFETVQDNGIGGSLPPVYEYTSLSTDVNSNSKVTEMTSLRRRVLLRHCEVLLFLHDTASVHHLDGPSEWLRKRALHEKFLDEFYAERKRISGPDERTLHPGNSLVNEADTITHEIVDTHARLNTTNAGGSIEIGEESIIQGLVIDSLPAQMLTSKSSDAAIISDENDPDTAFENSQRDIGNLSMYSNNMEHIIESFMLENGQHERQIESVFESETNPYVTLARYKHALLIVCMSNAKEVMACQAKDEASLSFLWESSTLAPALELLSEAQDRKGFVKLARTNIDRASVIYERALGPFAADTVRCMLESVRLGLRCLMGGNWGADYNEDSTMTTSVASKKPSRHQHSASVNSAKQLSSVYGDININGHAMSQSFVSNIMMSVRAGDNKADYSTYHTSNKLNHSVAVDGADFVALPFMASNQGRANDDDDAAMNEMLGESTYPFDSIVDPSDVEPETYNDAMASLSDEERRAETIHVNKAAIDVSRRLDKLKETEPESADKFARKCSNLIAMAELLASDARAKAAALLKAEKEGRWIMKSASNLPKALSNIISSRQKSRQVPEHSHYSSYISTRAADVFVERSESAPAVLQEASKQKSVRLADESRFVPNSSTMTGASERPSRLRPDDHNHKTRNTNNSHSHRTHGKKNIAESPRVPSTAPGFVERALSLKAMKTNNVTVKNAYMNVSSRTTTAQKGAILKLPKFSKNTFSSNLDPHFGASHSEWVNSFTEASTATFANDT